MRLKMTVFCTLIGLLLCGTAFAKTPKSALDVMSFADSFACNDKFPHHSFCAAVEFKPWSKAEKKLVRGYLRNIRDPRLAYFLKTIQKKGITKIHRVSYGSSWYNKPSARRAEFVRTTGALLWVNPVTNVIGFTDSFFKSSSFIDPYAKMDRKQLAVLHELAHVFDIALNHISSDGRFYSAAGWVWNGKDHAISSVPYEQVEAEFQSVRDLIKEDKTREAYRTDRELGIKHGFPTVYSMLNSHESFAECLTYLILDPTAESYLSKDVVQYFNSILKPAEAKQ